MKEQVLFIQKRYKSQNRISDAEVPFSVRGHICVGFAGVACRLDAVEACCYTDLTRQWRAGVVFIITLLSFAICRIKFKITIWNMDN